MDRQTETLGGRVQRLRLDAGLTQAQLADKAGLPVSTLVNYENDHRTVSLAAAFRLARALDVPLETLGEVAEHPTREPPVRGKGAGKPRGPRRPKSLAGEAAPSKEEGKKRRKKDS